MTQSMGRFTDAPGAKHTIFFGWGEEICVSYITEVVHYVRALYRGTAGLL
jgi:hypothetical protein